MKVTLSNIKICRFQTENYSNIEESVVVYAPTPITTYALFFDLSLKSIAIYREWVYNVCDN